MTETYKFSALEDKNSETADDYYPQTRTQQCKKSSVGSLQVALNSLKTQLKSHEIQQTAIKEKLNDLDLYADKLSITNQFLCTEADAHEAKHAQYLSQKSQLLDEIKEWKSAVSCLKNEALRGGEEIKDWKGRVIELQEREQELRQKIKVQADLNLQVQDYQQNLEDQILQNQGQLLKMRASKDSLSQTLMTLETFAKSFRRNIQQKEKEITKSKYQSSEIEAMLSTKSFEKGNFEKEKEKSEWECKMYVHHNKEIERTNEKLKADLEKLLAHLESLKKTNKNLDNCIKEYSQTGIAAAKKILTISNK